MPNSQAVREPTGLEVAIVGASVRFPGASDLDAFWRLLRDGTETISFFSVEETRASTLDPIPADDPQHVRAAGVVVGIEDFDAAFFSMSPREAEATDPQHRLFLECAWEAIETAGYGPDLYAGRIGVYASAGTNTYLLNNLCANRTFLGMSNALQMIIGNDKDYLATRVSYKLNLRGPSLMVQTACSSSLVAVHTACQALLDGDCDMALAGGASVNVPQTAGYRYQDGSIGSPDGHCRPFDADACGTVKSSGAGIVLLKRLEEALADGDTILAVIRGSAVNNDGSAKVSFSAPSAEGQAEAIEAALRVSEVDPESVAYIEAHGTGTRVGDPIEFAALERAFRARRSDAGTCAIGSVKTTLPLLFLAAWSAAVAEETNRDDVLILVARTGRPRSDELGCVGPFPEAYPLRLQWGDEKPFVDLLDETRIAAVRATLHHSLGLRTILLQLDGADVDFDASFSFAEPSKIAKLGGATVERMTPIDDDHDARAAVVLRIVATADGLEYRVETRGVAYRSTALARRWRSVLDRVAQDGVVFSEIEHA